MPKYRAPLRDMKFVIDELLDSEKHFKNLKNCEELSPDLLDAIIDSGAKFAENIAAPICSSGDEQGCSFDHGKVTTPDGYKEAFQQWGQGGWQALSVATEDGGQGLPASAGIFVGEMVGSSNWAFSMYTGLSSAPISCLINAGSEAQKKMFLPKLLTGEWAGTMCLTEAHCGSDVGLLRSKAVPNKDGTYTLTGNKIFISGGEQDMTDNIIHAILARVEGAPSGTKGISLFIVPKYLVNEDGSVGDFNHVSCGSIEKKMGIKASATCVMNYDGAKAYLLGEENQGLNIMFMLMNTARLGTALQGLAMSEASFQGALAYAKERLQMRSLTGTKNPGSEADPIIVHPDVRRMLMTQKAFIEAGRAFVYWLSQLVDQTKYGTKEQAESADDLLGLLTPIAKAFCTEMAQEVTSMGLQVFGGHGYIAENGMEQIVRDTRISTVYEGTTGIQSLDLLGRKVMGSGGKLLSNFTRLIHKFCEAHKDNNAMAEFIEPLKFLNKEWAEITSKIGERAMENADEIGSASVDYTMYSGYVAYAYLWAQMALLSQQKISSQNISEPGDERDTGFYQAKLATARFYFRRILPRTKAHVDSALAGADSVMAIDQDAFSF